jgi:hypothetical protein
VSVHEAAGGLIARLRREHGRPEAMAGVLAGMLDTGEGGDGARLALASCLWAAGRHAAAVAQYRLLLAAHPRDGQLGYALGRALMQTGAVAEGEGLLRAVAAAGPGHAEAQAWWGMALMALRRQDEALAPLGAALRLRPGEKLWHMARAEALLALGRWEEGWAEHAWRWQGMAPGRWRGTSDPLVRPDPAAWAGRTVLLFAEQGQGDTLQCLRYVPMAVAAGARVVLEVQPALVRLVHAMPAVAAVVGQGEAVPAHDVALPMFHLPWAFGTTAGDVPPGGAFLRADPAAALRWRERLAGLGGLKVGLVWAGEPRPEDKAALATDRRRSVPLAALGALGGVGGVSFVSVQVGAAGRQAVPPGLVLHDWTAELGDFAETAALMAGLDLVISVDTAPAHLAGALGREVWLLNRFDTCWRWLLDRDDSPWYPSLRQFRQERPGDWAGVVARVAAALEARVR